jgi:6-phosphogluconolactonase
MLYLASQGTNPGTVTAYSINLSKGTLSSTTGQLTPVGKSVNTGIQPSALVFNPAQTFAYTANTGSDDISTFTVNKDGSLTSAQATTKTGSRPVALAMDPAAHFLFVANEGGGNVSVFSIASGGALTQVSGSPFSLQETSPPLPVTPAQPLPSALAVSNQGNFLYVTDKTNGCVLGFSFNSTSGALSSVPGAIFLVGSVPNAVFSPPAGNFLYVANALSNDIYEFIINSDGSLSSITTVGTTTPVIASTGNGPIAMISDPAAKFLFVLANQGNQVSGYLINHVTGVLTAVSTDGTASTGAGPVALAIRSDGSTNGNFWLFTSNNGASTVSTFSLVYTTGVLNPLPQLASPLAPTGVAIR